MQDSKIVDAGYVQRREWMLYKIRPDHYPMNLSLDFTMDRYDAPLIQGVINRMLLRHEILRTTLTVIEDKLKQVIHPAEEFGVQQFYFDLKSMADDRKKEYAKSKIDLHANLPFNFEFGPLFRVLIFDLEPSRVIIFFVFHHLICDEYSSKLFTTDLGDIFQSLSSDSPSGPPPPKIQYRDYCEFENELLDSPKGEEFRNYWKERLSHGLPPLDLIDKEKAQQHNRKYWLKVRGVRDKLSRLPERDDRFTASVVRRYQLDDAGKLVYVYDERSMENIKSFLKDGTHSLMAFFIRSIILAFYRLSGQKVFAFEIPGSSRKGAKFKETMGWLTSGGPCFFEVSETQTGGHLLDHIDEQLYLLSKYCIYPPEAVEGLPDSPLGGHMPVFLTLSYVNEDKKPVGRGITFHEHHCHGTYQDIAFFLTAFNDCYSLEIIYDSSLFEPDQIESLTTLHAAALNETLPAFDNVTS